jgi:hypothetical protein
MHDNDAPQEEGQQNEEPGPCHRLVISEERGPNEEQPEKGEKSTDNACGEANSEFHDVNASP